MALLMAGCTEDYKDWAQPFQNGPEEPVSVSISVSPGAAVDFATITDETVKLFSASVSNPEGAEATYTASITNEDGSKEIAIKTDENFFCSTAELESAVNALWGRRPVARTIPVKVLAYVKVNGVAIASTGTTTLTATPNAPVIEEAYYITGTVNGWDNTNTDYELSNGGADPYENSIFTVMIPGDKVTGDIEFKVTPKSGLGGDWSKCLAAGSGAQGTFAYNNDGGNLVIQAVEGAKYYDLTFNMMELTWSYKAISFDPFVYFIGATDGWAASDQKLAAVSDGVYTGYLYVADPNGWGLEFKFQLEPGNWDKQLNSNNLVEISGDFERGGDNIKASAGEGVYFVNLDLNTNVLSAKKITNMNLVGDFNGWNAADDAQQMTWDAENYCYVITGAGVTANGWKFTTNNSWDINLGGTIGDLVANGDNLSVTGATIKLYPTRKTSDKIYCTVE